MTMSLFRAEWQKIVNHKWLVGFTMWIWPVGAIAVFIVFAFLFGITNSPGDALQLDWRDQALFGWTNTSIVFVQLLIAAFSATVFAGESVWNTWKNIVPLERRSAHIIAKYAVVLLIVFISFNLMAFFAAVGSQLVLLTTGGEGGPYLLSEEAGQFIGVYLRQMLISYTQAIFIVMFAAIAGLLMRSIVGGVIAAMVIALLDLLSGQLLWLAENFLNVAGAASLYRFSPSYALSNIHSWLENGMGFTPFPELYAPFALPVSLLVLAAWLAGLFALSIWIFSRRDVA